MSYKLLPDFEVESPEWFAARAAGVSASDMQVLGRDTLAAFESVKRKKQGLDAFAGNAYTEWGKEREPAIAAHVAFMHDIEPTDRICVSDDDSRWIASPDGIGAMLGEYKTTGTDWATLPEAIPAHYYDQVQWAQFVTGIHETVFAWEVRLGTPGSFVPGALKMITVPHDPERVAELVDIAERFWEYLQTEQEPGEYDDLLVAYTLADNAVKEASAELAEIKLKIRERAGDSDLAVKSQFGSISLSMPKPRETFDTTAFKKAHPEMVAEFTKLTPASDKTLRVTPKG